MYEIVYFKLTTTVTSINMSNFNTLNVISMNSMFQNSKVTSLNLSSFELNDNVDLTKMFSNIPATTGYAKDEETAAKFNDSSVTSIPSTLKFTVK